MKILALELSSSVGSVAFCGGHDGPAFRTFPADRKHSGFFFETVSAFYSMDDPPELIVVGLGPGSYAGVRIAIATAIGLRVAARARLIGLPSLVAIERDEYIFLGDARRGSFAFARVAKGTCLEGPLLATEDEIRVWLRQHAGLPIIATEPLGQFENVIVEHPSALRLAQLATDRQSENAETLEPIYLRPPYVTTPSK